MILFHHTVFYSIVLYCIVLCCIVLYCTVLYCTVLNCTVLYCTVLYSTVLDVRGTTTLSLFNHFYSLYFYLSIFSYFPVSPLLMSWTSIWCTASSCLSGSPQLSHGDVYGHTDDVPYTSGQRPVSTFLNRGLRRHSEPPASIISAISKYCAIIVHSD